MPASKLSVISASLFVAACTPATFGWQDDDQHRFARYRDSFRRAVGERLVAASPRAAVLDAAAAAGALWLGDHHRHGMLHGMHVLLLEELVRRGDRLALGLEAIGVRDQRMVDAYLGGEVDMKTLRDAMRTRWSGSWLDDRELDPWYFRWLLSFAKQHRIPVCALEPTPRLQLPARDEYIARSVAAMRQRYADRTLVVVLGQSHLRGDGDVVGRSGVGGVVVGGAPTPALLAAALPPSGPDDLLCTERGVYWFARMFGDGR